VSPAGATVGRDVLVTVSGCVVNPAQVPDVVRHGDVLGLEVGMGEGGGDEGDLGKRRQTKVG
jgi:hypothetical protein